jgi:hypothetical protein
MINSDELFSSTFWDDIFNTEVSACFLTAFDRDLHDLCNFLSYITLFHLRHREKVLTLSLTSLWSIFIFYGDAASFHSLGRLTTISLVLVSSVLL